MVLPLLGSLAGSLLAGSGAIAMSPIIAGAIGSGIGAFAQTGDVGKGLSAGATAALTGGLMGGLGSGALGGAGLSAVTQAPVQGVNTTPAVASQVSPQGFLSKMLPDWATTPGTEGVLGRMSGNPNALALNDPRMVGAMMGGLSAMDAAGPMMGGGQRRGSGEPHRSRGPRPTARLAPHGSNLSRGIETNYGFGRNYMHGGHVRLEQGGIASLSAPSQQSGDYEKQVISDAISALSGEHPEPEIALARALQVLGEDRFRALVRYVKSGAAASNSGKQEGMIEGEAAGDMVPATITGDGGSSDALLEAGEFIMPNEAVEGIGQGDHQLGTQRLYEIMEMAKQMNGQMSGQTPGVMPGQEVIPA